MPRMRKQTFAEIHITGDGPLMFGGFFTTERGSSQSADEHDKNFWYERMHVADPGDHRGQVYVPGVSFWKGLVHGAQYGKFPMPGRGRAMAWPLFGSGVAPQGDLMLFDLKGKAIIAGDLGWGRPIVEVKADQVRPKAKGGKSIVDVNPNEGLSYIRLMVPSDGKRNSTAGKVPRRFPIVREWKTVARIVIFDERITADLLDEVCFTAGVYDGLGSMRAGNQGQSGRWHADKILWDGVDIEAMRGRISVPASGVNRGENGDSEEEEAEAIPKKGRRALAGTR